MQLALEQAEAVAALQAALGESAGVEELLAAVVTHAAGHVPAGVHVAVTVQRAGHAMRSASSTPAAARCIEAEGAALDGPSLTSVELGHRVVADLATEARWPAWGAAASAAGFRTVAAVTRSVREGCTVTLTVLSERAESWDADALVRTELYAHEVARAIEVCLLWTDRAELAGDLRTALAGRAVIDQAVGVIMAENRCTVEQARAVLESASQSRNVDPRDVAAALIESVTGVVPAPPADFVPRVRSS